MVHIVGAGPGAPDLITLRGHRLLQQADVVLYANSLVPSGLLADLRPEVEKIGTANLTLEEIVTLMVERVRSHQRVVRLHDGDPSLYSALYEQGRALAAAEIPFEVIPGVSAFQAAAAALQTELTVPQLVQSIILTRISGRTQVPDTEALGSLAAHRASLCLYLSARHVENAQARLLAHYPADMPIAICYRVGWPDEQIWQVPLAEMAAKTQAERLVRTTLYLISPALQATHQATGTHTEAAARSCLYAPSHDHLFRPRPAAAVHHT
ncbi:MAG: precorrin-4 C(11)-methyltransferase [Cyanobacteria bacterium P01_A01_bin.105]